jgi:hypothetical protein
VSELVLGSMKQALVFSVIPVKYYFLTRQVSDILCCHRWFGRHFCFTHKCRHNLDGAVHSSLSLFHCSGRLSSFPIIFVFPFIEFCTFRHYSIQEFLYVFIARRFYAVGAPILLRWLLQRHSYSL